MTLSFARDVLGRQVGTLRAYLWRVGGIPYNTFVVLLTIALLAKSKVWNIRGVEH